MVVKIYTTENCPWCKKLVEFLKKHMIGFEQFNVAEDEKARGVMVEETGQMGVPCTNVDDEWVVGFDKEQLKKLLKK